MSPRRACQSAAFLLVASALGCGAGGKSGGPPGPAPQGPPAVTVATPLVQTVTQYTDVTGTFKARKRVEIRPQVSGYVKQVLFKDGVDVKEGDVLVTIDPALYTADVNQAKGALQNAEAQAKLAAADAARYTDLRRSGAATQEEYEKAASQKAVTEAGIASSRAALERAQQNLAYTKVVAPFAGRVDRILVNEGNFVAGGAGTGQSATMITVLTAVNPIHAYFDLDETSVRYYIKSITAGRSKSVRQERLPVKLQLTGEVGFPHAGELDFAGTEISPTSGSLSVRAEVPNPEPYQFLPGMFVKCRIPGDVAKDAVLVPDSAITVDQARKIIYVVAPGKDGRDTVSARDVKLGPLAENLHIRLDLPPQAPKGEGGKGAVAQPGEGPPPPQDGAAPTKLGPAGEVPRVVISGVTAADRIVVRGMQRAQDGAPVEAQPGTLVLVSGGN